MTDEEKQANFEAINPLVNALIDSAADAMDEMGDFQPHGAALMEDGEIKTMDVNTGDGEKANAKAVLSVIHAGLREQTKGGGVVGVGSAETVMIGEPPEPAFKVYAEHSSGFCMAFYVPFTISGPGEFEFADVMRVDSKRLISGWALANNA